MTHHTPIEIRLAASVGVDALSGTSSDRFIVLGQINEAVKELANLRAVNVDLLAALQAIKARIAGEYNNPALTARGPLRPHMLQDIDEWTRASIARATEAQS